MVLPLFFWEWVDADSCITILIWINIIPGTSIDLSAAMGHDQMTRVLNGLCDMTSTWKNTDEEHGYCQAIMDHVNHL